MRYIGVIILIIIPALLLGDPLSSGNDLFREGKYEEATGEYGEYLKEYFDDKVANNNQGLSNYKAGNIEDAVSSFNGALNDKTLSGEERGEIYFNLGNLYFEKQDLQKSLEYYKKSLIENPDDFEAKFNTELVLNMMKNSQQQQQQQQDQQQEEKEDDQQQQQQQQQKQEQGQNQQEQKQGQKKDLSKDEMDKILQYLENKEQDEQQELQEQQVIRGKKTDKDW